MTTPNDQSQTGGAGDADQAAEDENAVRSYLMWVDDPSSMRDEAKVAELQSQINESTDPIQKIHLASELHWAKNVDGTKLREAFLASAQRWAETNNIAPEAFLQLGVPLEDLRHAGFPVRGLGRRRSETGTMRRGGRRAPRVNINEIRDGARSFQGPFTIADLRDRVGGSPATIRKALDAMVNEGLVENLGADTNWPGPGRPPNRYANR